MRIDFDAINTAAVDAIQSLLDTWLPGDKVVWIRNDYDLDLFNGQIGIIDETTTVADDDGKERPALAITFDGRQVVVPREKWDKLKLAYALTVHKAQGSEWTCVIVICHKTHAFQHHRGWLYTAATRASRCCILIGDQWGMRNCAKIQRVDQRRSFLGFWLGSQTDETATTANSFDPTCLMEAM